MTNRIALFLAAGLIALLALDAVVFGSEHFVFLGKKMLDLIAWMAFWR